MLISIILLLLLLLIIELFIFTWKKRLLFNNNKIYIKEVESEFKNLFKRIHITKNQIYQVSSKFSHILSIHWQNLVVNDWHIIYEYLKEKINFFLFTSKKIICKTSIIVISKHIARPF